MLSLVHTRLSKLSEVNDKIAFFLNLPEYENELFLNKKNKITEFGIVSVILNAALDILTNIDTFDNDTLFSALSPIAEKLEVKLGTVMWCIRIAVSGMAATPGGATEIMETIGKDESISRIKKALSKLS